MDRATKAISDARLSIMRVNYDHALQDLMKVIHEDDWKLAEREMQQGLRSGEIKRLALAEYHTAKSVLENELAWRQRNRETLHLG